jgi:hypothetical protein
MLDYICFKAFITVFCGLPFMLKGACDIDSISQKAKNSLSPPKNLIERQKEKFKEYLPTTQENIEIWSFVFSSKQKYSICNHEDLSFDRADREFKKNISRELNVFRVGKDRFFVEVLCFWASYQGNFEFFIYEKSNQEISLKPLLLRRFTKEDNGLLKEVYNKSVAGLPKFNPTNKTLRLFARAGGGDCGSYLAEYKYEDNNLDLVVLKENYPCVRRKNYNPDQYPIIYPWQK